MNYTKNFQIGSIITIVGLGYNGKVLEYDNNGVMIIEWLKWDNESYKSPEFYDGDMVLISGGLNTVKKLNGSKYGSELELSKADERYSLVVEAINDQWNKGNHISIKHDRALVILSGLNVGEIAKKLKNGNSWIMGRNTAYATMYDLGYRWVIINHHVNGGKWDKQY